MGTRNRTQAMILLQEKCGTFTYGGGAYFTTIKAFQPELATRLVSLDFSSQVPFLGIEFTRAEPNGRAPTYAIYDYYISFYVVEAWYDDGTKDIDESVKHKWKVEDAFRNFLLSEAVDNLGLIMGVPELASDETAAEDLIFAEIADRGAALAQEFGAFLIVLKIPGVHEEIS